MISERPIELGRGVVILAGHEPPEAWRSCPRVVVGNEALLAPGPVVEVLHRYWVERRPVVVELAVDPSALRYPERCDRPVYELGPGFEFARERLQFLVWANNYDARGGDRSGDPIGDRSGGASGDPIWWHGRKVARRFADAGVEEGGPADILCSDGSALFVDGGPSDPPPLPSGIGVVHRWNAEAGRLRPAGRAQPSSELAPDQLAAVTHRSGAARVIAPAGSGKTRVLTERLRHLLADRGVHPATVTALAYNNKAAEELRQRCADIEGAPSLNIRTLNSLGFWICNEFGPAGRLRVLEEPAVRDLLQRHIEIRRQSNTDTVAPYLAALSAIRLGLASPAAVEEATPDASGIAEGFAPYRSALAAAGAVDFDEQIYRAIEILLADPGARAGVQATCRHVLVDEFQDLTPAHLLLIRLVAAPGYDCFGVGDDDQVIYGYSGATPEFLIEFPRYFPGATAHALTVNYRCPPTVIDAARHLLSYNARRLDKSISAPQGRTEELAAYGDPLTGRGPVAVLLAPANELAGLTVDTISAWQEAGADPADIAVLARVNSALLPVQVACMVAGIPCTTPLSATVLQRTGIRTAFAYLRIGSDPGAIRREDIQETIRRPSRGMAPQVVEMLTRRPTTSIADIRRLARRLSGRDVPKLEAYAGDLERVAEACGLSSAAALETIRVEIGLGDTMDVLDASRREADRSTHGDDLAALESVAVLHPEVATFEAWLRTVLGRPAGGGGAPGDRSLVLLSTVHRIKGREWDHVVIFGASRGLFPHRLSGDDEGERRVFHVALTRARTQVVAMADAEAPSIFLAELDGSRVRPSPRAVAAGSHTGSDSHRKPSGGTRQERRTSGTAQRPTSGRRGGGPAAGTTGDAATSVVEEALRSWRSTIAIQQAVPAYVILKDTELAGIARRDPRTLAELAACRGMGPIRLERWGDEILAVLEAARSG